MFGICRHDRRIGQQPLSFQHLLLCLLLLATKNKPLGRDSSSSGSALPGSTSDICSEPESRKPSAYKLLLLASTRRAEPKRKEDDKVYCKIMFGNSRRPVSPFFPSGIGDRYKKCYDGRARTIEIVSSSEEVLKGNKEESRVTHWSWPTSPRLQEQGLKVAWWRALHQKEE